MTDDYNVQKLSIVSSGQIIPRGFIDAVINRYLPVLSFTFVAIVAGVALKMGHGTEFLTYFFKYKEAYLIAAAVCLWVSGPAVLWILLQMTEPTRRFADTFYIITTCAMLVTLLFTLLLFPTVEDYLTQMARLFIVAAIPIHVIQYVFLVRGGLPFQYSATLNLIGASLFVYGFVILH
jgi:hypothetical protein